MADNQPARKEYAAQFSPQNIEQLAKMHFSNEKTRLSNEALAQLCEMIKIYTLEIAHRAAEQARQEGTTTVTTEHLEKVLPQLLLDFT